MELEHSFTVPVPEDRAWDVLLDVERVAPCMPGATLESVDGDEIRGSIKVKVGPINMVYKGTARFTERDPAAHVITLEASGKETRGAGTASARVRSMLEGAGEKTHVIVHTTLNVTGKPAQFGRGVLAEVGGKLIGIFAANLEAMLEADSAAAQPAADHADGEGNEVSVEASAVDEALPIDVLNLGSRAWSSLRHDGIQTLGDLTRRTEQQLLAIDNIGPASVADIRSKLADRGMALAESAAAKAGTAGPVGKHAAKPDTGQTDAAASEPSRSGANGQRSPSAKAKEEPAVAPVTPLRPAHARPDQIQPDEGEQPAWQPQDTEAIDLLGVAGVPVLKRVLPAAGGVLAVLVIVLRMRRRRRARS
ncbi:MAG: SRPBCC domain-containing protein [Streptosporangiaceae bacterium]